MDCEVFNAIAADFTRQRCQQNAQGFIDWHWGSGRVLRAAPGIDNSPQHMI